MKKVLGKLFILFIGMVICCGAGYNGSLPDINAEFEYKRTVPKETQPIFNQHDDFSKPAGYKKIPRENKSYIDVIMKKDKTSDYINDLNDIIPILEKMKKCIDSHGNVQKFNAVASSIIDQSDYMQEKYANKPERYYISFAKIMSIAANARAAATLLCESQVYVKYLTYQGEGQVYSKSNIEKQITLFEQELVKTIKILKDST